MRHLKKGRSLHRDSSHRKALLCNLAVSILMHERVQTTEAKAKEVRGLVDQGSLPGGNAATSTPAGWQ